MDKNEIPTKIHKCIVKYLIEMTRSRKNDLNHNKYK